MQNFFLFIATCNVIIRMSYGNSIPLLHSVFVSNVVDPNDQEIEELSNFLAFPFNFYKSKYSLISHMGLLVNYSVIFSSEPEDITTIRALDLEHYSINYFRNMVQNHTRNQPKGASLKGLRKALTITSNPSIIFLAVNTEPEDTDMLKEILVTIKNKLNPVILFQINKNVTILGPAPSMMDMSFEAAVVQTIFDQIQEQRIRDYYFIAKASESALFSLVAKVFAEKYKPRDRQTNLRDANYEKTFMFIYDVINATESDLDRVSKSILIHLQSPYKISNHHLIVFSIQETSNWAYAINTTINYTAEYFQEIIKYRTQQVSHSFSLRELLIILQSSRPSTRIVYYVNGEPKDGYEILPQILQAIMEKKIEVSIYGCGNLFGHPLPVVYRTILDAYKFIKVHFGYQVSAPDNNFLPLPDE